MTRSFNSRVVCEHCGRNTTAESAFERWMRGNCELDSTKHGIVRFDLDLLLHRYKFCEDKKGSREIQCVMLIEIKTHGADVTPAQQDTLSMFSQVIRNRRQNICAPRRGRHADNHAAPCRTFSRLLNRDVSLWLMGAHLLQLSGSEPMNSDRMTWDKKQEIDIIDLVALLRFERDPDTLKPIDHRRRSYNSKTAWPLFTDTPSQTNELSRAIQRVIE